MSWGSFAKSTHQNRALLLEEPSIHKWVHVLTLFTCTGESMGMALSKLFVQEYFPETARQVEYILKSQFAAHFTT